MNHSPLRFRTVPLLALSAVFSINAAVEAPFEVGTWANFCQGAVSHTFDDNTAGQTGVAQPIFDAKRLHMTLFTVTQSMNPNWTKMKSAFAAGHEIASHSVTHAGTMPDAECPPSQNTIRRQVPGEPCITIAYPNCNVPNPQTELKRCYIAGRICNGQIENKTPSDFYRIGAIMAGNAGTNTASGFNDKANQAASSGGWLVWCHHGVGNDGHGYSNTSTEALRSHIDFLDRNRDKIWTETFGNVACYIKERNTASLSVKNSGAQSITITLTDNLPDSLYNYPLTIRRPLPEGWTEAKVTQGDESVTDSIVTVNGKKMVMFQAVPDGGDILLSSGKTPVQRHTTRGMRSGALTMLASGSFLTLSGELLTAGPAVVQLYNLNGTVLANYRSPGTAEHLQLPLDNIAASTFITEVTVNGTTLSQKVVLKQ